MILKLLIMFLMINSGGEIESSNTLEKESCLESQFCLKGSGTVSFVSPSREVQNENNPCGQDIWWETGVPMDEYEDYKKCVDSNSKKLIITESSEGVN